METIYNIQTIKVRLKVSEEAPEKVDPDSVLGVLRKIYADLDEDQEHFTLIALNQKNHIRGYKILSSGGQTSSIVDPRVVFRCALMLGAAKIIIAHNHPSGDPEPNWQDENVTRRLQVLGSVLDVKILDHIVLGQKTHYSFLAAGRMNEPPGFDLLMYEWERQKSLKKSRRKSRKKAERKPGEDTDHEKEERSKAGQGECEDCERACGNISLARARTRGPSASVSQVASRHHEKEFRRVRCLGEKIAG
jgi:DNA repair protein RadC